ncbi:hypothetical protein QYF61_012427 [Mycteria americana]|uniref:Uncharacterized protein n=1 Tax=Mycteria americana TaxID=33587 RepID=A0AAN7RS86_MYCAM|nr:hypothetical protein QYF61_012427 [Mycteria americana]
MRRSGHVLAPSRCTHSWSTIYHPAGIEAKPGGKSQLGTTRNNMVLTTLIPLSFQHPPSAPDTDNRSSRYPELLSEMEIGATVLNLHTVLKLFNLEKNLDASSIRFRQNLLSTIPLLDHSPQSALSSLPPCCREKSMGDRRAEHSPGARPAESGWRLNHFPGQPVPMLDNPFGEEIFPNIQSKPPLAQLEAIFSRPITCYLLQNISHVNERVSAVNGNNHQHFLHRQTTARLMESQNRIDWKRPLRSSSPTINLTLPRPPLYHVPKHLIQTSFKYLQGWRLNHFPGQPVPMLDNPFSEEKFPNIQSKPPLAQLETISSCPITCYLGEETDPHLSTTSFQVAVESNKVSPQPPFLQAKQSQLPQPLLIRLLLQTLHQLRCPSLDMLQHLNIPLVVGGPKLNTVFEVRPHQCRVQGHDHFPTPAGHTSPDTSQDAIGFLGHLGTLLAHIQAAVNKHPQVLFRRAAFQPLFPKPVALHGVAVAQVQDLALGLVKPHTIGLGPSIQPVQVPLQSLPTLKQINTPTQLGVICKLTESALDPFIQIIDKDIKQNWPQHRALGNTACDRPPAGVNSIHHHSMGPAIQPVLYPVKRTPVQAMSSQFLQENTVGNCIKGFTEA